MAESQLTSSEHLPQAVVVHVLVNRLGKDEVDGICGGVDEARKTAPALPFIIDMAKVDYAGSLAIGVLVGLHQEFRTRGQRLIFVNLQFNLSEAFKVTRINRIMEILPDVPAALKSVEGSAC
jgi:anti-anti-sigma factor